MQEGVKRLSVSAEESAEAELDPGDNAVKGIGPQVLPAKPDNLRLTVHKNPYDIVSRKLADDKDY